LYYALIMAGGSGTRLWPLSREARPKQSLKLIGGRSMFQHAVDRLLPFFDLGRIWVVTREGHKQLLQHQVPDLPESNFILEPEGRGTAPAIGLAAIQIFRNDPEAMMAVLTADHYITEIRHFQEVLSAAQKIAQNGSLVTLGITPSKPSTAFGYIEQGSKLENVDEFDVYRVRRFTEKPDRETANRMISSGKYSWNSGMFIWQVKRIMDELRRQMPEFYKQLMEIDRVLGTQEYPKVLDQIWPQVSKETIDYGVMEGAENVVVIPVEIGWTDVGSWDSLIGLLPADAHGNIIEGVHEGIETSSSLIIGEKRLIATIGVNDLVIVDTEDALLVCARGKEQKVREIVDRLRAKDKVDLL
jgi:mannose-1-phosphate guanylyltransferase